MLSVARGLCQLLLRLMVVSVGCAWGMAVPCGQTCNKFKLFDASLVVVERLFKAPNSHRVTSELTAAVRVSVEVT